MTSSTDGLVARVTKPAVAAGAAVVGVAGGVLLGRSLSPKHRKVLGVPLRTPTLGIGDTLGALAHGRNIDLKPLAKGVGRAGQRMSEASDRLAKLTKEVDRAGKTAQQVGKALS